MMARQTILILAVAIGAVTDARSQDGIDLRRIALCKMIQDDVERLRCFDTATGGALRSAQAGQEQANAPKWIINDQDSAADRGVIGLLRANRGDGSLVLRCRDERTEAQFSTSARVDTAASLPLTYWIDDAEPIETRWNSSVTGNSILAPTVNGAVAFIRSLPDHGRLRIRIQPSRGEPLEATFALGAISALRAKIADACSWRP